MKSLYLTFDDKVFKKIKKTKVRSKLNWEHFFISLIPCKKSNN